VRLPILIVLLLASCNRTAPSKVDKSPPKPAESVPAEDEPEPAPAPSKKPLVEPMELPAELDEPELEEDPDLVVALPPGPAFDRPTQVDKYEAGEWSVAGLRKDIDTRVEEGRSGTEILLRAYVQEIYVPPVCPVSETCVPPKQPHVWVVDDPKDGGKRNAMMVVNYAFVIPEWDAKRWEGQDEVVLEVGEQYTFKGKFRRFSDSGFASERGLLEFLAVRDEAAGQWVYPPGAPWHPLEIARQEEQNRMLMEKAREEAKKRPPR